MKAFRNLRLISVALLLLALIGTAGFHFIEGWPWFDGLYMVVTTFTTIGYQEIHPLSHAGRIFNLALIVSGVSLVFLGIGSLTQALLEFELASFFGRRKMEREISRLSDHYIICGAGRVGRSAARELARRPAPFLIIEQSEAKAARYNDEWLIMIGDATQEQTLRDAHIECARGLVAATTTDATNLYIVLTARGRTESAVENNCPRQRRRRRKAPTHRRCGFRGLAIFVRRAAHRAIVSPPARGQFSGYRHYSSRHGPGNRRNLRAQALF